MKNSKKENNFILALFWNQKFLCLAHIVSALCLFFENFYRGEVLWVGGNTTWTFFEKMEKFEAESGIFFSISFLISMAVMLGILVFQIIKKDNYRIMPFVALSNLLLLTIFSVGYSKVDIDGHGFTFVVSLGFYLVFALQIFLVIAGFYTNSKNKNESSEGKPLQMQENASIDDLKKYKDLLDSGVISQEEFDAKKKQLLGL